MSNVVHVEDSISIDSHWVVRIGSIWLHTRYDKMRGSIVSTWKRDQDTTYCIHVDLVFLFGWLRRGVS